jgi:hypothetical protein
MTDDLLTLTTRAGGVTPTRLAHVVQTSVVDATLTVGANEQITVVVTATIAVLTRKWSNKSEVTSATISAPV